MYVCVCNHTHSPFIPLLLLYFFLVLMCLLKQKRAKEEACPFSSFQQHSVFFWILYFFFPLNFFVFNSLKVKCVHTIWIYMKAKATFFTYFVKWYAGIRRYTFALTYSRIISQREGHTQMWLRVLFQPFFFRLFFLFYFLLFSHFAHHCVASVFCCCCLKLKNIIKSMNIYLFYCMSNTSDALISFKSHSLCCAWNVTDYGST